MPDSSMITTPTVARSSYNAEYYRRNRKRILAQQRAHRKQATTQVQRRMYAAAKYEAMTPEQRAVRNQATKDWYAIHGAKVRAGYVRTKRLARQAARELLAAQDAAALNPPPHSS
jgi:uncharacterized protein (DUF2252 family)